MSHSTSRSYLKSVYEDRVQRNKAYSLRAFARSVGVAPSYLLSIFSGAKQISSQRAEEISERLRLATDERTYFVHLVELERATSVSLKGPLQNQLKSLRQKKQRRTMGQEVFSLVAKWYYPAILAMTDLPEPLTAEHVTDRLRLPLAESRQALEVLTKAGWLKLNAQGRLERSTPHFLLQSDSSNQQLRAFHEAMLEMAKRAYLGQSPRDRITRSETLAINVEQLPKARRLVEEFLENLVAVLQEGDACSDVFHLNLNFFSLRQTEESK